MAAAVDRQGEMPRSTTELFTKHAGFIRTIIHYQANGRFDEEDFFQELFLLMVQRPIPADVRNIKGYLYRAVLHHIVDLARRQQCYQRNLKRYARETRISINNRAAANAFDEELKAAAMTYVVRYLHERQAQAFMLRYWENCTISETAARMGVDKRTVSRYLSEGLKKLQKRLAIE